jgi:uncharacterized membrane protein YidH (DUF202 family)
VSDILGRQQIVLLLIPLLLTQLGLLVYGVWDWSHRRHFHYGNRWVWFLIIVLFSIVGPLTYLLLGREES